MLVRRWQWMTQACLTHTHTHTHTQRCGGVWGAVFGTYSLMRAKWLLVCVWADSSPAFEVTITNVYRSEEGVPSGCPSNKNTVSQIGVEKNTVSQFGVENLVECGDAVTRFSGEYEAAGFIHTSDWVFGRWCQDFVGTEYGVLRNPYSSLPPGIRQRFTTSLAGEIVLMMSDIVRISCSVAPLVLQGGDPNDLSCDNVSDAFAVPEHSTIPLGSSRLIIPLTPFKESPKILFKFVNCTVVELGTDVVFVDGSTTEYHWRVVADETDLVGNSATVTTAAIQPLLYLSLLFYTGFNAAS
eukprot:Gregarina_sp_Pseudo_9__4614@NODE_47_length_4897_cov_61_486208_g44_i0_p3_GENE_NODE_47_length_4897_cov_61_486208_g44_i0NODE_47_length_4897_cov_61_486208_g44_i0_p3_ORF_typecomplete_len297_score54_80_NODE_47_length_4897_cov_61_486208_g44_i039414831